MFFIKLLVLISTFSSLIFSSAIGLGDVEQEHQQPLFVVIVTELPDDWLDVSFSLPRTKSGIFACLMSEDPETQKLVGMMKIFVDEAYNSKELSKKEIKGQKSKIESFAREALDKGFNWGSIGASDVNYKWRSEKVLELTALELIGSDLTYFNLALEVKSLLDDGLLKDEYLKSGADRAKLRSALEESFQNGIQLLDEIKKLQAQLDCIRGALPSPKPNYSNMGNGDCF